MFIEQPEEKKRRTAIYIRVSTTEQKIDGYSLGAQERRLKEHIDNNKALNLEHKKEWLFMDVHTGSELNRPALTALRKAVKEKKVDAVLVWKIDRLSRSLKHLLTVFEELEENEASFISVQENLDFSGPIGRLIFQIFGAIAQFERELIKGRTQMGRIASAEMGNYTGTTIPYGYEPAPNPSGKGKTLNILEDEQKWVQSIFNWYIFDSLGYGQISQKLNKLKVRRGKHSRARDAFNPWTAVMIEKIIKDEIYRGRYVANKKDDGGNRLPQEEWTIVKVPACISDTTYLQAQKVRKYRYDTNAGKSKPTVYLLSGKIVDTSLDKPKFFSGAKRYKGGFSYRRKQFKDKDGVHVPVFEIPGQQIDEWVWNKIMEAMKDPEQFVQHYLSKQYIDEGRVQELQRELDNLRGRKAQIESIEIPRIETAYERGMYSDEKLQEKLTEKEEELNNIQLTIQEAEDEMTFMSSVELEIDSLKDAAKTVKHRLHNLTPKQKRIICDLFIDRIEMFRKKKNDKWDIQAQIYYRFNPEHLAEDAEKGRTTKQLKKATNDNTDSKNDTYGGSGGT